MPQFDFRSTGDLLLIAVLVIVFMAIQFLPTVIASKRNIDGSVGVLVINIVGIALWYVWVVGLLLWAGALVWAVSAKGKPGKRSAVAVERPKGYTGAKVMNYRE